jgi:hypothetical protein
LRLDGQIVSAAAKVEEDEEAAAIAGFRGGIRGGEGRLRECTKGGVVGLFPAKE